MNKVIINNINNTNIITDINGMKDTFYKNVLNFPDLD